MLTLIFCFFLIKVGFESERGESPDSNSAIFHLRTAATALQILFEIGLLGYLEEQEGSENLDLSYSSYSYKKNFLPEQNDDFPGTWHSNLMSKRGRPQVPD